MRAPQTSRNIWHRNVSSVPSEHAGRCSAALGAAAGLLQVPLLAGRLRAVPSGTRRIAAGTFLTPAFIALPPKCIKRVSSLESLPKSFKAATHTSCADFQSLWSLPGVALSRSQFEWGIGLILQILPETFSHAFAGMQRAADQAYAQTEHPHAPRQRHPRAAPGPAAAAAHKPTGVRQSHFSPCQAQHPAAGAAAGQQWRSGAGAGVCVRTCAAAAAAL